MGPLIKQSLLRSQQSLIFQGEQAVYCLQESLLVGLRDNRFLEIFDENVDVLLCHRTRQTSTLNVAFEVVVNVVIQFCFNPIQRVCDNIVVVFIFFPHPLKHGCQDAAHRSDGGHNDCFAHSYHIPRT